MRMLAFTVPFTAPPRSRRTGHTCCSALPSASELAAKPVVFLGSSKCGDEGAVAVGRALAHPTCAIVSVNMDHCGVTCVGAAALAQGLAKNRTLEELVMSDNEVGDAGAAALAGALNGTNVRCLYLAGNRIGEDGGVALGNMLGENEALQTIYLMGQVKKGGGIGDRGAAAWAGGIAKNRGKFWFVNLNNNGITQDGLEVLRNSRTEGRHHVFPVDPYPR